MEKQRNYEIIMATDFEALDRTVGEIDQCEVKTRCHTKAELEEAVNKLNPHIVIISNTLKGEGNIPELMIKLKKEHHYTRFIYLAGRLNPRDTERVDELGRMVLSGIYDIYTSDNINLEILERLIKEPKSEDDVSFLAKNIINNAQVNNFTEADFIDSKNVENMNNGLPTTKTADDGIMDNVYVFTSIKPGSGKSFLSANVATAIAAYGKVKSNGEKPTVALIEADLQTLSLGTILNIEENKKKNLKAAMTAISNIFDRGNMIGDEESVDIVNKIIKECMIPYKYNENLHVLTGSTLTPEEVTSLKISPEYYIYLLDVLRKEYDVVIVDTNSSMFHITTYPILQKAAKCFYILNLDVNNIRNNLRYYGTLKKLGLLPKIKWVLNENIENTKEFKNMGVDQERLEFTADDFEIRYFKLSARIPIILKSVFLNRNLKGKPIILDENVPYTVSAQKALLELSKQVWPVEKKIEVVPEKKPGFFQKLFKKKEK